MSKVSKGDSKKAFHITNALSKGSKSTSSKTDEKETDSSKKKKGSGSSKSGSSKSGGSKGSKGSKKSSEKKEKEPKEKAEKEPKEKTTKEATGKSTKETTKAAEPKYSVGQLGKIFDNKVKEMKITNETIASIFGKDEKATLLRPILSKYTGLNLNQYSDSELEQVIDSLKQRYGVKEYTKHSAIKTRGYVISKPTEGVEWNNIIRRRKERW